MRKRQYEFTLREVGELLLQSLISSKDADGGEYFAELKFSNIYDGNQARIYLILSPSKSKEVIDERTI